jgi:predicted solute-binding protein
MKILEDIINRSLIVVKIHAAMVSCAVNDLQNEEDLKILDLGILFFSYF